MSTRYKLIVNVPLSHADTLRKALGDAGAGKIGHYSHCSFSLPGTGRFLPDDGATPHIGQPGKLETVDEEQIQVDVEHAAMRAVLDALKSAHPYEEIGYEIYPVLSEDDF